MAAVRVKNLVSPVQLTVVKLEKQTYLVEVLLTSVCEGDIKLLLGCIVSEFSFLLKSVFFICC